MDADPDILTFAKGIASGFPLAGIATKPDFFQKLKPGSIGGTYSGSTLGCAAACATLDAIVEDNMLENATIRGKQLVDVSIQSLSIMALLAAFLLDFNPSSLGRCFLNSIQGLCNMYIWDEALSWDACVAIWVATWLKIAWQL